MNFLKRTETVALALFTAGALSSITFGLSTGCASSGSTGSANSINQASGLSTSQSQTLMQQIAGIYGGNFTNYITDPSTGQVIQDYQSSQLNLVLSFTNSNNQIYATMALSFADGSSTTFSIADAEISTDHKTYIFTSVNPWVTPDISSTEYFAVKFVLSTSDGVHINTSQSMISFLDCGSTADGTCTQTPLKDASFTPPVARLQ